MRALTLLLALGSAWALAAAAPLDGQVHAFYYLWYGEPQTDGAYVHWNHGVLEHWDARVRARYPSAPHTAYEPPADLHSPFYPARGPYSSRDAATLDAHMAELAAAGVDAAVVSWWGRPGATEGDSQGVSTDAALPALLAAAERHGGVKVAFHLEPYRGRSAASVKADVAYLLARYGESPALLRDDGRAVFYVYDSYHVPAHEWRPVLAELADEGFFLGLWLYDHHGRELRDAGFGGAYSYFGASGFSYGSSPRNWRAMAQWGAANGLAFVPCVAPGYNDERIRPWNIHQTHARQGGIYYDGMWEAAIQSGARAVAVTSFNEWGEGTQIEPAQPRGAAPVAKSQLHRVMEAELKVRVDYDDYLPHAPDYYLARTRAWAEAFRRGEGTLEYAPEL